MTRVLAHPVYRRLFLAQVVALTGTGLATVALGLLAFDLAGGDAGIVLGTAFAAKMVAYVAIAPLAATLLGGLSRKTVLVASDVVRLAAALALPFVGQVWQVYVLIFVLQAASAAFMPTFQAVIPAVLPDEDEYTEALSLSRLADDLEAVLSPMLAGLLLLVVSSSTLFFGTAAGFAGSALLVLSTVLPRVTGHADAASADGADGADGAAADGADAADAADAAALRPSLGTRLRRGATLLARPGPLRPVLALNLAVAAAGAFVLVQTVVIVRETFGLGSAWVPLALAANGAGSMAAALLLPRVLGRRSERTVMLTGAAALAASMALVPLALWAGRAASPVVGLGAICVLWVGIGLGWSCAETPVGRLIRRHVPTADLPTAFAAQFSLSHACWLVTYPLAGWLGTISLPATAWLLTGVTLAAGLVAARWWPAEGGADRRGAATADAASVAA